MLTRISNLKSQVSNLRFEIPSLKFPLLLISLFIFPGCTPSQPAQTSQETFFPSPDEVPLATRMFDAQAARGARADATLHAQHFDGQRLNSLGKSKIDLMLSDTESDLPLKLYVDGQPADPAWIARADAVKRHLVAIGLTDKQFQVVAGVNPDSWHPVAKDIEVLNKPDTSKPATDFTPAASTASAPPPPTPGR